MRYHQPPTRPLIHLTLLSLLVAAGAGCAARRIVHVPPTREGAPYSRAVWVGDVLYLAGDGEPHEDPVQEAHRVMKRIQDTLATQGLTPDDLVQVTVYCSDVSLYDTFNKVYRTYFKDNMPARAFVGSGDLLWGMRYEVQGIAVRR